MVATHQQLAHQALRAEAMAVEVSRRLDTTTKVACWSDRRIRPGTWHRELGEECDRIVDSIWAQDGRQVSFSAPPRHGKTQWVGIALPLRCYVRARGEFGVFYVTSTATRAKDVSRKVRAGIERLYALTGCERYAPGEKWTELEWETTGGLAWKASGWSGATGGIGCQLLILDDMIGTSEVYRSPVTRMRIRRVLEEDLDSRVMDGGAIVHMETRRGVDDTTGWLQRTKGGLWAHAVWRCHGPARGEGDAAYLWPEKYAEKWRRKKGLPDSSPVWRALYQQEPVPEGGTQIDPAFLRATYPEDPRTVAVQADRIVIGVDLAKTAKTSADHCAFVVLACRGAYRDILEVVRVRAGYVEQRRLLRDLAAKWRAFRPLGVLVELAANGDAIVEELQSEVPGIYGQHATQDKIARLTPWLPTFAALQVRTPTTAPWLLDWRAEMESFAGISGEEDDQVDATVWALVAAGGPIVVGYDEMESGLSAIDQEFAAVDW
jgi:predicted phage terminase large subunit-like protein